MTRQEKINRIEKMIQYQRQIDESIKTEWKQTIDEVIIPEQEDVYNKLYEDQLKSSSFVISRLFYMLFLTGIKPILKDPSKYDKEDIINVKVNDNLYSIPNNTLKQTIGSEYVPIFNKMFKLKQENTQKKTETIKEETPKPEHVIDIEENSSEIQDSSDFSISPDINATTEIPVINDSVNVPQEINIENTPQNSEYIAIENNDSDISIDNGISNKEDIKLSEEDIPISSEISINNNNNKKNDTKNNEPNKNKKGFRNDNRNKSNLKNKANPKEREKIRREEERRKKREADIRIEREERKRLSNLKENADELEDIIDVEDLAPNKYKELKSKEPTKPIKPQNKPEPLNNNRPDAVNIPNNMSADREMITRSMQSLDSLRDEDRQDRQEMPKPTKKQVRIPETQVDETVPNEKLPISELLMDIHNVKYTSVDENNETTEKNVSIIVAPLVHADTKTSVPLFAFLKSGNKFTTSSTLDATRPSCQLEMNKDIYVVRGKWENNRFSSFIYPQSITNAKIEKSIREIHPDIMKNCGHLIKKYDDEHLIHILPLSSKNDDTGTVGTLICVENTLKSKYKSYAFPKNDNAKIKINGKEFHITCTWKNKTFVSTFD